MLVSCYIKWQFWLTALHRLALEEHFPSALSVWEALFLAPSFPTAMAWPVLAVWQYHWRFIIFIV